MQCRYHSCHRLAVAEQSDASGLPTVCFSLLQRPLCTVLVFVHRDPDRNHSYSGCGLWFSVLLAQVATMVIESDSDTEKGKAYLISMLASGLQTAESERGSEAFSREAPAPAPPQRHRQRPLPRHLHLLRAAAPAQVRTSWFFVEKRIADRQRQGSGSATGLRSAQAFERSTHLWAYCTQPVEGKRKVKEREKGEEKESQELFIFAGSLGLRGMPGVSLQQSCVEESCRYNSSGFVSGSLQQ